MITSTPYRDPETSPIPADLLSPIQLRPDNPATADQNQDGGAGGGAGAGHGSDTDSNSEDPEKSLSSILLNFHNDNYIDITG